MDPALCGPPPGTSRSNSSSSSSDRCNSSSRQPGLPGTQSPVSGPGPGGAAAGGPGRGRGRDRDRDRDRGAPPGNRKQLEGVLSKYTNLIQGWQNRYFVLDPEPGLLLYFVNEQGRSQKPRGSLPLVGATVTPSDEAPHMFVVNSVNGELYKLRASDTKEQQFWISHLQACARRHSDSSAKLQARKLKGSDEHLSVEEPGGGQEALSSSSSSGRNRSFSLLPHLTSSSSPGSQRQPGHAAAPANIVTITHHKSPAAARRARTPYPGRLLEVKEVMSQAEGQQKNLVQSIDSLPTKGPLSCLDQDLLLLKATSAATLSCLGECLSILQQTQCHGPAPQPSPAAQRCHGAPTDGVPVWTVPKSPSGQQLKNGIPAPPRSAEPSPALRKRSPSRGGAELRPGLDDVSPSEEVTDTEDEEEEDLGVLDDQRSVILHLLSQLKLGMDLTRVVLPTFILEKRSLLEMYANFMSHPDMFLSITAGSTAEERMVRFVEYYLTAFHEGRRGAVAKKPYNPVLGEIFRCSWEVPQLPGAGGGASRVCFVAEQVSHHPPVSAFYCECRERRTCVNVHVWTRSKFMGMSVGVSMIGEGVLCLLEHGEEYVFSLPAAYARSILTVPWVELGGKVSIACAQSGYSAGVTFHTKPFYGGKVHRVTAEVKHTPTQTVVCRAQGEWNGTLEFIRGGGETRTLDATRTPLARKRLRPAEKQGRTESRRLWRRVTEALKDGKMEEATEHKRRLEEQQRDDQKRRDEDNQAWTPRYFRKEGDGWLYKTPLWSGAP